MEENAKEAKKDLHGQQFLGHELGVFLVQVIIHIVFLGYRTVIFAFSAITQQCNCYALHQRVHLKKIEI